jgi:hypothetical protein
MEYRIVVTKVLETCSVGLATVGRQQFNPHRGNIHLSYSVKTGYGAHPASYGYGVHPSSYPVG